MPTSFASMATALRMRSASAASVASASGSPLVGAMLVKIRLQDKLGGDLVAHTALLARGHAGVRERSGRGKSREAFVDQRDGHAEAALELPREASCARRQFVLRSVCMRRQ